MGVPHGHCTYLIQGALGAVLKKFISFGSVACFRMKEIQKLAEWATFLNRGVSM